MIGRRRWGPAHPVRILPPRWLRSPFVFRWRLSSPQVRFRPPGGAL